MQQHILTNDCHMQAPGELVEVLAEKVLLGAQNLLQVTAELKRRAFLANSGSQLAKTEGLGTLAEAQERIASLEDELSKAEEVSTCKSMSMTLLQLNQADNIRTAIID